MIIVPSVIIAASEINVIKEEFKLFVQRKREKQVCIDGKLAKKKTFKPKKRKK